MKELVFAIVVLGVFSIFYPGMIDAGMYGEVYIPEHEFIGFFDENETYTVFAGIKNKEYFHNNLIRILDDLSIKKLSSSEINFLKKKRILITGVSGVIGINLLFFFNNPILRYLFPYC